MRTSDLYISAACRIRNNRAWRNGLPVYEGEGGSADEFMAGLYRALDMNYPKWYKMDRLCKLGLLAAEMLWGKESGGGQVSAGQKAIVLANRHSSLDTDMKFISQMEEIPSPAVFVYTLPNIVTGEISIRYGCKGEQAFFISESPDFEFLQQYTRLLFSEGQVAECLLGWVDILGEQYQATLYRISGERGDSVHSGEFTTENLSQYFYHEQGAVS